MKINIVFILFACLFVSCKQEALSPVADQKNHFNHQIFEENKLAPRATFFGFENASISNKENSKRFISLNGDWNFNWVKDPKQRPITF